MNKEIYDLLIKIASNSSSRNHEIVSLTLAITEAYIKQTQLVITRDQEREILLALRRMEDAEVNKVNIAGMQAFLLERQRAYDRFTPLYTWFANNVHIVV